MGADIWRRSKDGGWLTEEEREGSVNGAGDGRRSVDGAGHIGEEDGSIVI